MIEEALQVAMLHQISPANTSPSSSGAAGKEQQAAGVGILLQIMMLVLSFVLGHVLRRHKVYYLPEASASLLIGLIVGGLANISNTESSIRTWFNFHEEFFFLFLLPPIILYPNQLTYLLTYFVILSFILNKLGFALLLYLFFLTSPLTQSGFSLAPKPFFSNFGAIVTFAILGTFISSIVTGVLVYLGGVTFLMYRLPFVECLMFGALISATDPVTVLSIFQSTVNLMRLLFAGFWYRYEPVCFSFGESVLNDAMAISLYRTMSSVKSHESSGQNFFLVIIRFLETFVGSMSSELGVLPVRSFPLFLVSDLLGFYFVDMWIFFSCLLEAWIHDHLILRYMLAEGLGLSGIVSILFTGMVMKHYTFSNLSENSQRFVAAFFHLISSLAETFVAANVFSCGYLVNLVRPANRQIPIKHQKALWYSGEKTSCCQLFSGIILFGFCKISAVLFVTGLRGAMAFALALQSVHDLPDGHGQTIFTATTAIVVLTVSGLSLQYSLFKFHTHQVLLIGGSTGTMLEALQVVGDAHDGPLGEPKKFHYITGTNSMSIGNRKPSFDGNNGYIAPSYDEGASSGSRLKMRLKEFHKSAASFTALDRNYLTPFFTTQNGDEEEDFDEPAPNSRGGRGFRGRG
ncbi:hypothetical protein IFM89_039575 [Coptis chinensis]|uniref:Cation/H+ exchanger transmembrane domain-containing protein n=2 Tax=Magnoliopsida TaxID=3398 RepID=A0A835LH70_9MAGN|nr:hypothetical protein IFM89_039575 [Coptis chinensis]